MQTKLPFFPSGAKLINSSLGYGETNGVIYYFHSGNPIYCHDKNNRNGYKFAVANLIVNNLCTIRELSEALGERRKNIERYAKSLRDHGAEYFFARKERRGECHKMTAEKLSSIQSDLDDGVSIYRSALNHNISEAAISYHIHNGNLKKNKKL